MLQEKRTEGSLPHSYTKALPGYLFSIFPKEMLPEFVQHGTVIGERGSL